jgi:hypothetical protein
MDGMGDVRMHGAGDDGLGMCLGVLHLGGSNESVPRVYSDSMGAVKVVGGELETCAVALCLDGMGVGVPIHSDSMSCVPSKAGDGLDMQSSSVAGLVLDMGGGELHACACASSGGISINPLEIVVYSLLTAQNTFNICVSVNWVSCDAINEHIVGSSSLYPFDLSTEYPNSQHFTDMASSTPWGFCLIPSTWVVDPNECR